ncbi:copper-fist-domain-containing protein, partial [Leucogyrophana mollusca]
MSGQVLVSDKKYACETCIKGHRSSACKHTDRPLFEIKKKGRPVTQCEHCRELRKTKQVHVKCLCGLQEQGPGTSDPDSGKHGVPATAAFPNGLPEALGALVTPHLHSDGSADSDHSGDQSSAGGCKCNVGGPCHCCTPRKTKSRRRSSAQDDKHSNELSKQPATANPPPLSSHVLARIAELRPVLPRPSHRDATFPDGPLHDPSSGLPHGHGTRHHTHDHTYYSPYGRAYEQIHATDQLYDNRTSTLTNQSPSLLPTAPSFISDPWSPMEGAVPSTCACGDSCRCPGCTLHNNSPIPPGAAYSSCTNPASCSFCLDCTILSISPNPPDATAPTSGPSQYREFDDWLRQISTPSSAFSP